MQVAAGFIEVDVNSAEVRSQVDLSMCSLQVLQHIQLLDGVHPHWHMVMTFEMLVN